MNEQIINKIKAGGFTRTEMLTLRNNAEIKAKNGNLEMLVWASENGCHCTEYTCNYAIKNGHLFILKYLLVLA
jgi:hypothetical protein